MNDHILRDTVFWPIISTNIWVTGKTLKEADQFNYLGSQQTKDERSIKELKIRLAQAHSAMTRPAILWKNKTISFPTKFKLYKSLVLTILLYGCERWTLRADLERRIQAFENKCYRRMLCISYKRALNKLMCMAIGQYTRRTSGAFTVNCQSSQNIMILACMSSWYAAEDSTTRNSGWQASQRKTA